MSTMVRVLAVAVNYFETYGDRYEGVTGASIRAAIEDPKRDTDAIASLARELGEDAKNIGEQIEGDIEEGTRYNPQEAQGTALEVVKAGRYACGLMTAYSESVDVFDRGVNELNRRLRSNALDAQDAADRAAEKNDTQVPEFAATFAAERAKLVPEYRRLDDALEDAAESTANMFRAGVTDGNVRALVLSGHIAFTEAVGLWPKLGLDPDERRRALRSEVGRLDPRGQADWVRRNSQYAREVVDQISDEAQKILAGEVADDIREPKNVDTDTVRIMDLFKDQEAFAHSLYSDVTPEQVGGAVKHLSKQAYPTTPGTTIVDLGQSRDLYKSFLTAAGVTFATYTKGTGAYAPPSNLVDVWKSAITADDSKGQGAALTLLLRSGGRDAAYDPGFISGLTDQIYDWERGQDGKVWGPRNDGVIDPFGNPRVEGGTTGVVTYSSQASDGLANVMAAMGKTPEAARGFFSDGQGGVDQAKLDYLIGVKDGEHVNARTFSAAADSDEGEGLGLALEAAGVRDGDSDQAARQWSADFTSDVFNRVADLSGHGKQWYTANQDDTWRAWPGMGDNLATMAANYASDVYDILDEDGEKGPAVLKLGRGGDPSQAEVLEKVLGEVGRGSDKSGIETLAAAVTQEGNARLAEAVAGGDHLDISGRAGAYGEVLGRLAQQAITVDRDDEALAASRAKLVSKALDIGGGFIPGAGKVLGEGASEMAKATYSTTTSQGLSVLKEAVKTAPTSGEWLQNTRASYDDVLRYHVTNQLYRNGAADVPHSMTIPGPDGTRMLNPQLYPDPEQVKATKEYTADEIIAGWDNWAKDGVDRTRAYVHDARDGLRRGMDG